MKTVLSAVNGAVLAAGAAPQESKPGMNQVPVVTWTSFGPSPKNLVP